MFLCNYKEYGSSNGESMTKYCQEKPYEGKEKIVFYLRNKGRPTLASTRIARDRITNERIKGEFQSVHYTDGKYSWCSDLAYHVEKYNLRLPKEFEDHVLNHQ
ncbi:MAG: hypothetical protein HDT44_00730 [Ruminococcaceae bacterium]|nr:hypothetical protein [Oscillospiraceae bacterium]